MRKVKMFVSLFTVLVMVLSMVSLSYAADQELDFWATAAPTRDDARQMVYDKVEEENPGLKINFEGVP